jgi:hypothetical protein
VLRGHVCTLLRSASGLVKPVLLRRLLPCGWHVAAAACSKAGAAMLFPACFSHRCATPTPPTCRISADRIQVAINLNGYTKGARNEIFALLPAPVQASYMGFPATTGAPWLPYLITDKVSTWPPGACLRPASTACWPAAVSTSAS